MNQPYVCADDCGLNKAVNAAVMDLAERRCLSATGLMVQRGASVAAAASLRRLAPGLIDVGLHLDLGALTGAAGSDGHLPGLIAASYLRLLRPAAVRAAVADQLVRFEDLMGRPPAFVDGHQHVHQLPQVRECLVEQMLIRYDGALPWLRITAPPAERWLPRGKADVIFALGGRALRSLALRHGVPASTRLLGVYDFQGDLDGYRRRMSAWRAQCRPGDVLMCHPATHAMADDPHAAARQIEYAVLCEQAPLSGPPVPAAGPTTRPARS